MNLARFLWIFFVELFDEFETVRQMFDWFPSFCFSCVLMTSPSNQIKNLAIVFSRIEDRTDFVFRATFDLDWRWRWLSSIGDSSGSMWRKKRGMKYWMEESH